MKKYVMTIERRQLCDIEFEAGNDSDAEEKAFRMYDGLNEDDIVDAVETGSQEFDFAVSAEDGRQIVDWG